MTHTERAANLKNPMLKGQRLEARVSTEQKDLFYQAAKLLGRTLTDFVVSTLQEAATKIVQEHEVLRLNKQDQKIFVQALLKPAMPNKRLLKAKQRHQKMVIAK